MTKIGGVRYNRFTPTAPWTTCFPHFTNPITYTQPVVACLDKSTFMFRWFLVLGQFVAELTKNKVPNVTTQRLQTCCTSICCDKNTQKIYIALATKVTGETYSSFYFFEAGLDGKLRYINSRDVSIAGFPVINIRIGFGSDTIYIYGLFGSTTGDRYVMMSLQNGSFSAPRILSMAYPDLRIRAINTFDNGRLFTFIRSATDSVGRKYVELCYYDFASDQLVSFFPNSGQPRFTPPSSIELRQVISRYNDRTGELIACISGQDVLDENLTSAIMVTTTDTFKTINRFDVAGKGLNIPDYATAITQDKITMADIVASGRITVDFQGNTLPYYPYFEFLLDDKDRLCIHYLDRFDWYYATGDTPPQKIIQATADQASIFGVPYSLSYKGTSIVYQISARAWELNYSMSNIAIDDVYILENFKTDSRSLPNIPRPL